MSRFHLSASWNAPISSKSDSAGSPSEWIERFGRSWGGGGHRSFFLPLHYEPNYAYPLIVWLHNDGFNEHQVDHVMPHISVRNFIAVGVRGIRAADSMGHRFDWHTSGVAVAAAEESVMATLAEACDQFSVNQTRIVLAGYGNGGTMAMRIALRHPSQFAAAISLGGGMPKDEQVLSNLDQLRAHRLRMLWAWGTSGPHYCSERLQEDLRLAMMIKARLEVRQYAGDDEMDTVVLSDVNDWVMRSVVSDQSSVADDRWSTSPTVYSAN